MQGTVKNLRPFITARKLLLTGTPVSESPANAYSILSLLAPERVAGVSKNRWDSHFIIKGAVPGDKSFSNLEELKRMLESVSVRRLKVDVRGMPDKTESRRECEVTADQAGSYGEIMLGILAQLDGDPDWAKTLDFAMVKILRARQCLSHPKILGLPGDSGKHRELDNIVEEVLSDGGGPFGAKVLIWCEWLAGIDALAERYRSHGVLTIDGRTSQQQLTEWEKTFDTSPQRIVVATPARGGTGLDWLSRCRTAVYIEKPYSTVLFLQSQDRVVRRVGEDEPNDTPAVTQIKRIKRSPATILYLHVPGSVDDAVDWVLRRKLDLGAALLTTDERLISDGRDDLIKMLRASAHL